LFRPQFARNCTAPLILIILAIVATDYELAAGSAESKAPSPEARSANGTSPEGDLSTLRASNEFLKREISLLERELEVSYRELKSIRKGYSGKIKGRYQRWLARNRHGAPIKQYEMIAVAIFNRTIGRRKQNPKKRYQRWIQAHELTSERIEAISASSAAFPFRPLISVFISLHAGANESLVVSAIDSVRAQLYDNWEIRIASDGASEDRFRAILDRFAADDTRIQESRALQGEFVVFLDQHGQLSPDALFGIVRQINRNLVSDLIYWDEDKIDAKGSRRDPFFKPDWSPDLILSMNYVGRSFAVQKRLLDAVGGVRLECADHAYDLLLRAGEHAHAIVHIPQVLFHQNEVETSSEEWHVIEEALRRRGLRGKVETSERGGHCVRYEIRGDPKISIIIPTRDKCHLLRKCIESITKGTDYANYEIIVLDNDSRDPVTLKYFREVSQTARIFHCPGPFNFSAINNRGATEAHGDFLLFLNNDTEVLRPDWIRALIEQAQRPEIGAVGAKLLFRDGRIQHAGVVLGVHGVAAHAFRLMRDEGDNRTSLAKVIRNCSAVTGACMMIRRSLFEQIGRFDEGFPVDFNDVDLCLRLRERGYLIVYTPLALLRHHESATRRGFPGQPYQEIFMHRWGNYIRRGDPYYNRNLTLVTEDWNIAV
jgi:GT2 family glycosyltransferase